MVWTAGDKDPVSRQHAVDDSPGYEDIAVNLNTIRAALEQLPAGDYRVEFVGPSDGLIRSVPEQLPLSSTQAVFPRVRTVTKSVSATGRTSPTFKVTSAPV